MNLPYHLEASASRVDFYTVDRLPLQPSGRMLSGRDELRAALSRLDPKPGCRLDASLTTLCPAGGFDMENVLFYNVGVPHFRNFTLEGVSFRMRQARVNAVAGFNYHHRYEMTPVDSADIEPQLAFHLDRLDPGTKPHSVWWNARHGTRQRLPDNIGKFRLSVLLESRKSGQGVSDIMKAFLDGVVSSFHHQPREMDLLAIRRLAEKLGVSIEQAGQALSDARGTPLGARKVLSAYREGVKWNPADDLCMECVIQRRPSRDQTIRVALAITAAD